MMMMMIRVTASHTRVERRTEEALSGEKRGKHELQGNMMWVAWFLAGSVVGAGTLAVLVLLAAVILVPLDEANYSSDLRSSEQGTEGLTEGAVVTSGSREARWQARRSRVESVVKNVGRPLLTGLRFSDVCVDLGFTVAIRATRINFWLAKKSFRLVDKALGSASAPALRRFASFLHFVEEVVGYAELATLLSLTLCKVVVHVVLQSVAKVLELHRVMSPRGVAAAAMGVASAACFDPTTLESLRALLDLVGQQGLPLASALRLDQLGGAAARLRPRRKARDVIQESLGKTRLLELDEASDVSKFVMFALGTYGQVGLKFLGIIPYGAVASDLQAVAYCAGLPSTNAIVACELGGNVYAPGYAVCIDETARSVVVAVRGSIRPHDFLTDLACRSQPVTLLDGVQGHVHEGMWRSAQNLDGQLRPLVADVLAQPRYKEYDLVVAGHSLGAGVGVLLAALWLTDAIIPVQDLRRRLRVFGYGTPAVASPELARALAPMVTSVVMGNDMVPRFSLRSFQRLRDDVIENFANQREPGETQESGKEENEEANNKTEGKKEGDEGMRKDHAEPLVVPGKVLWIDDETQDQDNCEDNDVVVLEGQDVVSEFQDMTLCESMFSAHLPQHYAALGHVPLPDNFF